MSVNLRALLIALFVCAVAIGTFLYVWYRLQLPFLRTEDFLIGTVLTAIALLTVNVFQSMRTSVAASHIAKGMATNMLIDSREMFTELYRGSPVPYLVIDRSGTVDSANYAAVRLFGVEMGWLEGKNIFEYVQGETTKAALIPQYFAQNIFVNSQEVEVVRPDGGTKWVMLSLFSFKDAHKRHKGLLTLVDITKQKEIDKAKTEFVSLASHQLRTPLSALRWNMELLETSGKDHFSPGEHDYIEKLKSGVARMDTLITDFLSVSKLELGTLTPHVESVQFTEFMDAIIGAFENQVHSKQMTVEREWHEDDVLRADPHLLEMAVSNLVSNAVKYSPEGGVVHISSHQRGADRLITISDMGMGIPLDEQDRVFTKIFRATNAKAEVPDGTGLGLYIAREAVRVMGGDVTFVSKESEGTTFTILLPE